MPSETPPPSSRKVLVAGLGFLLTGLFVMFSTVLWGEGSICQATGVVSAVCWAAGIAIIVLRKQPWLHESTTETAVSRNPRTGENRSISGDAQPGQTLVWITVIVIVVLTLLYVLGAVLYAWRLLNFAE